MVLTTTVGHGYADDLTIGNSGDAGITVRSGTLVMLILLPFSDAADIKTSGN